MKIAIFWPNWIGDAVMATPAVRALRDHFPQARLLGVMKPYIAGVLEGSALLDEAIFLDATAWGSRSWVAVAWTLRKHKVDVALLFPNSFRTALTAWAGNCGRRIGYARYGRSPLLTDALAPLRDDRGRLIPSPIIAAYNSLAEKLGCKIPSYRMELGTTPLDDERAAKVWADANFAECPEVVCLNPGAAFGAAKHWPTEYFSNLAQSFADRRGSGVLVLCGPAERDLARSIATGADRPTVHSLADRPLSLGLTKACVRRANLLVTTDSGPRHFGTAFDRPVVTLFGPTHIAWTETYHPAGVNLQKQVPCGPCQQRVCHLDHRCMTELRPEEVYAAAVELLDRDRRIPLPAA